MTEFIQVPRSVLSKLWAPQPSGMQPCAKPSCQGRADSKRRMAAPDGHLTVCPWSQGWGGDWEGHRHLSLSPSLLVPCQGQKRALSMASAGSFLLHSSASKMQLQRQQPYTHVLFSQGKISLVSLIETNKQSYQENLLYIYPALTEN